MTKLDRGEVDALNEALDDEYQAWATYDQVIRDFGEVRPFVNIRDAEARHVQVLAGLFERYALTLPDTGPAGAVTAGRRRQPPGGATSRRSATGASPNASLSR